MKFTIEQANSYIEQNKEKVNDLYRLKYHMIPPIGWMNDPNGLIKINETYHLFYQYYPYDSKWGPMHWGHFSSKDLIKYENLPVALCPNTQINESGCFSGSAIFFNNSLNLIYTKHFEKDDLKNEEIYLATSKDGIHFQKEDKAIFDNQDLPANISRRDFRDPYIQSINGYNYLFVGGKDLNTNQGIIIVLKSQTLHNFKYDFTIGPFYELGEMAECPSYAKVENKDVLIVSGCNVKKRGNQYNNLHSSVFIIGKIDFNHKKMMVDEIKEIDHGDAFYAPQFITNEEGVMIGWLETWGKEYPTNLLNHKWAGAFSIPRKLYFKENNLCQIPIENIRNYYQNSFIYQQGEISSCSDLNIKFKGNFEIIFSSNEGEFKIGCQENIYLDTINSNNLNGSIRKTSKKFNQGEIRVLLDKSSVEVFIDGGEEVISSRVYVGQTYTLLTKGNVTIEVNTLIE